MIGRLLRAVVVSVLVVAVVLGAEVWLALRRDYLPTDDPLELGGRFGPATGEPLRLVVLGDSTAAGLGAVEAGGAYATVLADRLAAEMASPVRLDVLGVSGARVRDVLDEQLPRVPALDPDLVFVGIGANDVTHLTALRDVRADMTSIVAELRGTGAGVVVAGPPHMGALAWHQPLRYVAYLRGRQVADAIEDVAVAGGAAVVELEEETGNFFAEEPETHFSADGFHPSAVGYRRWADAIFPVLIEEAR